MTSLSAKQREVIAHNNAHNPLVSILEGAVRSGKTFVNNLLWNHHVAKRKNEDLDFIITGHTIGSITRNVLQDLEKMFGLEARLDQFNRFRMYGNTVHCFGTDNENAYKAMTGFTAYGWYGNEVTLQHQNSIRSAFERCSGDGFRIFWDTNPDYPDHPIKIDYIDKSGDTLKSGRERIRSCHFTIEDNPFLTEEYVENLKTTTPAGMWYDRKIKGLWVAAEGLVYELYDRNIHVQEFTIGEDWQRCRSIDWGFNNPFVCLFGALDPDDRLYVYDEIYLDHTLLGPLAGNVKSKGEEGLYRFTVADHDPGDAAEFMKHGVFSHPAQKDVAFGIEKVAERLVVKENDLPRLLVHPRCVNLIHEIGKYAWAPRKEGRPAKEEPVKKDDHALDGLRYMVMEIDNPRIPEVARAWA